MQKKKEKFLDKIVKKDYNNELETILEKKAFDESAKNLLLNIVYKIEASYKDYEKVKTHVASKEEYIQHFIKMIKENCESINICKINSKESDILGDKTFLASLGFGIQYPNHKIMLVAGAIAGMIASDSIAILSGKFLSNFISQEKMQKFSGILFLIFGIAGFVF